MLGLWAAVPETSIYKYNQALATEYKVRFTKQPLIAPPASNAVLPKQRNHPHFSVAIATRPDARHH